MGEREKNLLVAGAAIILVLVFYHFIWADLQVGVHQAREREAAARARLLQAQDKVAQLPDLQRQLEQASRELAGIERNFRLNLVTGDPYLKLATEARAVQVVSVQPQSVENRGFYLELPLTIRVRGKYDDVVGFIGRVERLANLPHIHTLEWHAVGDGLSLVPELGIEAEITLSLYGSQEVPGGLPVIAADAEGLGMLGAASPGQTRDKMTGVQAGTGPAGGELPPSSGGETEATPAAAAAAAGERREAEEWVGKGNVEEDELDISEQYRFPTR